VADDPGWRDRCARQWRAARIKRFEKRQQEAREWINFADIADWCSKEDQSILPDERKREATFDTLASDLLAREFEENGRSRVLFLHPTTAKARMTPEWFKDVRDHNYDGDHGRSYLAHCWIRRRLFERWLVRHRLPAQPPRFQPQQSYGVSGTKARDETAAIKALAAQLKANPQMKRVDAVGWCHKSGYKLGKRAFDRVWPQARERAGLARIAAPGRKSKSPR